MSRCPTFGGDGPSGIAEALRVVDCLSGEAASFAFARLFGSDAVLGQALTAALTLYIGFYAVGLLTGRVSIGLSSLTPRMMTLGIALTFATSWIAYQSVVWNLLSGAPDQVASLLAGTRGSATVLFADRLDAIFAVVAQAAVASEAAAVTPQAGGDSLASGPDLLWLSAMLLLLGTVGVLLVARIALAAMLALGPIFIICGLFEGSRGLFEGWVKAAVLFALTPLLAVLIGGGTIAMLAPMIDSLAASGGAVPLRVSVSLFLASAVYCALMFLTLKMASTMVGGWRIRIGRDRSRRSEARAAPAAAHASAPAQVLEPSTQQSGERDPRVRAIVSAATGGAVPAREIVAARHLPLDSAADSAIGLPPASPVRSDPRVGNLSRRYHPRLTQPARISS